MPAKLQTSVLVNMLLFRLHIALATGDSMDDAHRKEQLQAQSAHCLYYCVQTNYLVKNRCSTST
jgi:hypothetical protein